ncbi:Mbeg1-like protein [Grimontia sp. AD028]|uniref:lipase family protein n=1 Tax=Grimontia sp. AD028 TaxID=1581149 RepID=UPI000AB92EA4|nr:Mbeg1-like protein [Grimontia sp. AD028]
MKKITACSLAILMGFSIQSASATTQEELGNIGAYVDSILNPNMTNTANATGTTYKTHQPPSINQAGDALHYLAFAEYVYKSWGAPSGWTLTETIHDSSTGFHAAVYTSGSNAVIAFRGSELGTSDWVNNGIMAAGEVPPQYRLAISESARLASQYSSYNIHYTGHSLGGGLATVAAIRTGKPATVFDASGIGNAVLSEIQQSMANAGVSAASWSTNAGRITNYNLEGEFVSDGDYQQDADVIGVDSKQYGNIFYLSAARFTPLFFLNTGLSRHFTTPLREELQFLSQPVFRVNANDWNSIDNDINGFTALFYIDWTDDTLDLMAWQAEYAINSFPSFLEDL